MRTSGPAGMIARRSGRIVNMASGIGLAPFPYSTAYACSKAEFCQVWRQRNESCNLLAVAELGMVDRKRVVSGLISILFISAYLARDLTEPCNAGRGPRTKNTRSPSRSYRTTSGSADQAGRKRGRVVVATVDPTSESYAWFLRKENAGFKGQARCT